MDKDGSKLQIWKVEVGTSEKSIGFRFFPLKLSLNVEIRFDPAVLRKIMDFVQSNDNYHLFPNVSEITTPDYFSQKDVDFIIIIARSTKTAPYGILIIFDNETRTFQIEALWPESFATACQNNPKLLDAGIKALVEHPQDFLGVSV
ncbi:MAG: hypothetical protein ACFFDT_30525, partial [Candidatus Hodarchaeota archaeon]